MIRKSLLSVLALGIATSESRPMFFVDRIELENECRDFKDAFVRLNGRILAENLQSGGSAVIDRMVPLREVSFSGSVNCGGQRHELNKVSISAPFSGIGENGILDMGYGIKIRTSLREIGPPDATPGINSPDDVSAKVELHKRFLKRIQEKRLERLDLMRKRKR